MLISEAARADPNCACAKSTVIAGRVKGVLLIILGASAWGTLGVFATALYKAGLRPVDVAAARVTVAWIGYATISMWSNSETLRITPRDLWWMVSHGMIAVALYNLLYFGAIDRVGIAPAVALLYTAPAWGTVLGYFLLGERYPARIYLTVPMCVLGVAFVVVVPHPSAIPLEGVMWGLGAALAYALFSIQGKPILRDNSPVTLLFYSFGSGGIALLAICILDNGWGRLLSLAPTEWIILLLVGIFPTFLAYLAYAEGLRRTPASLATLLATVEPVIAVSLGVAIVGENLSVYQICGIALIVTAAAMVARRQAETAQAADTFAGDFHAENSQCLPVTTERNASE